MSDHANDTAPVSDSLPADPSPATETTPNAQTTESSPSSGTDATASPPSGDTPPSDREGLLAAVRAVVKPNETPAVLPAGTTAADPGTGADAAGTNPELPGTPPKDVNNQPLADPSAAELKQLRPETRRRFEQLLSQRDEARAQLTSLQPELDQHRQLRGYLEKNQLAPDDVNMLLGVGASLRRGEFQAFLNGVMPYVQAAQEALGLALPPDLRRQVDEGLITEETARDLTKTRFRANQAEDRLRTETSTRAQERSDQNLVAVRTAIETWEDSIRKRDPDYSMKAVAIRRFSQALLQERGAPRNPADAVKLVTDAYNEATAQFVRARPPPQPTRVAPSGINGTAHGAASEPKTMKEAAIMALAGMRRAS